MDQSTLAKLEALKNEHPEVNTLVDEHRTLDDKAANLTEKAFLTAEEELELHRLKKEKLRLKDRIEVLLQERQSA